MSAGAETTKGPGRTPGRDGAGRETHAAWSRDAIGPVALLEAIAIARRCTGEMTGLPIDGISASGPYGEGGWRIVVEVIESAARLGDNDLISMHEVLLTDQGELTGFSRIGRYHREDGAER
jgi:hypothetical protein